ncbi:MAG TPA: hypothetical protein VFM63_08160 [Pyrinomonadaceae bacterium]|nr:hypothetical protein [Pyrinomonadaceae bacterium]
MTRTLFGVSLALFAAFCCLTANAQSGRRQAKPPAAAPVPTPTPEPTPKPATKRDNDNEFSFLVASGDRGSGFSNLPLSFYDAATIGCADQLAKRTSLAVDVSQRELHRGEAIGRAKSSKTTYVVLITLIEDRMSASSSNYPELEVDYVVFAPGTAKVVASGRTFENAARKGPISVGRPRGTSLPSYREALLRRAGEDAADRIVKSLHLSDPPKTKSSESARGPSGVQARG